MLLLPKHKADSTHWNYTVVGNRTFRPFDISPLHWAFRPLDVLPPGRFPPVRFAPWTFRPQDVSPLARVNKVDWLMDWCTFFIFKSLYLYTITRNIAKFGWNIHTNDGTFSVTKIASIINCISMSCEIVMPRSLKCYTLSTMTGLLVEQSDKCWGVHFARGPRIISLVLMKFIFILFGVAQVCNCWRNVCMWVCCEPQGTDSIKVCVVSSTYLWVRQSTVRSSISSKKESRPWGEPWGITAVM